MSASRFRIDPGKLTRQYFNPNTLAEDITAGVTLGVVSVPDGLAAGLLALVNPIYGLYGYMLGTFTGALFTSSVFMSVQATGAMALVVASVPQLQSGPYQSESVWALAILTGIFMLAAGLLRLGRMVRFVPNAVMTGFVNAVAINIVLGQLADFTGYRAEGANRIMQTLNLARSTEQIHLPTLMIGITTIVLILVLEKTRLKSMGLVVAMLISSLLVALFSADNIQIVNDVAVIPDSLPLPTFPPLRLDLWLPLLVPAISLAFVGLVQGAGISKNFVNPDGTYPEPSGDFRGQGIANIVAGVFQGMPVGGSMSATALVTGAGARSRLANLVAGVVMAISILLFGGLIGRIAMPALAALLIVIGFRTLRIPQARSVWKTGNVQRAVMLLTFLASLLIPLQYAVLIGVALAVLLYVVQQSNRIAVKQWTRPAGRYPKETDPPAELPPNEVTALVPYGSLFFATASLFEEQLPDITEATRNAAVVLVLRMNNELGSTFMDVLARYAAKLDAHDSRLILAGVDQAVKDQLDQTGMTERLGRQNIFLQTENIGESFEIAWLEAEAWISEQLAAESGSG